MSQLSVTWQTKRTLVKPASEVSALLKLPVAAVATIEDQETDHLSWTVREFAFQKALILDHGGRAIEETIFDGSLLLNGTATMPGPSRKSRSSWQLTRQKFADALAEDRDRLIIESNELTRAGIVIPQRLRQMSNRFELSMLDALRSGRLIAMAHSGDKLSFTIEITNERQKLAAQTDLVAYERQLRTGVGSDDNIKIELDGIRRLRDSSSTLYITYSAQLVGDYWAIETIEESYPDGSVLSRTVNSSFAKVPASNIVLPALQVKEDFSPAIAAGRVFKEPLVRTNIVIKMDSEVSIPHQEFDRRFSQPGTTVIDLTGTKPHNFQIPVTPGQLDKAIDLLPESLRHQP
jgi:hypothetical protein